MTHTATAGAKRAIIVSTLLFWFCTIASESAKAGRCLRGMVPVGSFCIDQGESSVWQIPPMNPGGGSNASLIKRVQRGKATVADLTAGGAVQLGLGLTDDYPCSDSGAGCTGVIYAVSILGVVPSANITWFQAQQACGNSGKRLPRNGEWQMAANGTLDAGPDNGTTDCNTASTLSPAPTGSRSACVSSWAAFDMGGNMQEWTEDWLPMTTASNNGWGGLVNGDAMTMLGASTTADSP